ncbi:WecB/TagA/CpsF family glycosyltransferase [uncultured Maribacter sp.]|uniref:WecB/TagA/CpsF family glycosyltransferase n=1 Tax=uncultured Maribacter sp. TaxID=431308 RepID=UPI002605A73E|nr:WecB/TagA/CpsF family glycosyltransferase [uncultured Maribacter sp.]
MTTKTVDSEVLCLGYPIYNSSLENLPVKPKLLVSTINQYSYCISEEDAVFKNALLESDVILPDGVGIVAAAKWLNGVSVKKIAGADFHEFQLKRLNEIHGSCFYLGASNETLAKIGERLKVDYPNVTFGSYSPPYKPEFSEEDNLKMIEAVNAFQPDVLFVGMTAPKQEKWSHANKDLLDAKIICSIGAVFDFYAGTVERPNKIWQDLGLEWLGRLLKEPKRMAKRYIYYGGVFTKHLVKAKFSSNKKLEATVS